jgi:hypothetical protein
MIRVGVYRKKDTVTPERPQGYEPGNVRWATRLEQRHNRRPPQRQLSGDHVSGERQ